MEGDDMSDLWFTDAEFRKLTTARSKVDSKEFYETARSVKGFGYIPKEKIYLRYIADKIEREKSGLKKLTLRFPGKQWEFTMRDSREAKVFGQVLAGASHAGMWLPHKKHLNAMEVADITYPNKQGVWWYLIWDASGKTFVVQKYHFGKDNLLEPTNQAKAIDSVDYYSDAYSSSFSRNSLRLRKTRAIRDVRENPFALMATVGRNIGMSRTKNPQQLFEMNVMSWNERLEPFLQSDGELRREKFEKMEKRGKKWIGDAR